jgi:hypothetical protein
MGKLLYSVRILSLSAGAVLTLGLAGRGETLPAAPKPVEKSAPLPLDYKEPVISNPAPPPAAVQPVPLPPAPPAPPPPAELPWPVTGREWDTYEGIGVCPLIIKTPKDGMATFVKVVDAKTNAPVTGFFIRPGDFYEVLIPMGDYRIKYARGTTWYGPGAAFGANSKRIMMVGIFSFFNNGKNYMGNSFTLLTQVQGNVAYDNLTQDQF